MWGIGWITGFLLVYRLSVNLSFRLHDLRIQAEKFTWDDLDVEIEKFSRDYIVSYGIRITNNKQFKVEKASVKITKIEIDKDDRTPNHLFPVYLAWLDDRKFHWGEVDIESNGGVRTVAFLRINNNKNYSSGAYIPGPDGQPSDKKSIASLIEEHSVMYSDYLIECSIDNHKLQKTMRVKTRVLHNFEIENFVVK